MSRQKTVTSIFQSSTDKSLPKTEEIIRPIIEEIVCSIMEKHFRRHALSIIQNGKMPVFLSPELVEEIFKTDESSSAAVKYMREGLNVLGLYDLFMELPELKFLLQPCRNTLTMKKITTLLKPKFSAEGSNAYRFEKEVYGQFNRYLREVSALSFGGLSKQNQTINLRSDPELLNKFNS